MNRMCVYTMYGKSILLHYFQHLYLILCSGGKTVGYFKCDLTVILFRNDGENRNWKRNSVWKREVALKGASSIEWYMCDKNKVHISAFVRYDFAGFTKPKDIPTIELVVGFGACILSSAEACSDITHTEKRIRRFFKFYRRTVTFQTCTALFVVIISVCNLDNTPNSPLFLNWWPWIVFRRMLCIMLKITTTNSGKYYYFWQFTN